MGCSTGHGASGTLALRVAPPPSAKQLTTALAILLLAISPTIAEPPKPNPLPDAKAMAAARDDVWGEAALRHPDGPSYEFFRDLLPPLHYVNTAFRHYPIVLCAPSAAVKGRWVSNGSGLNLRADKPPMWREVGVPVTFHVGDKPEPFGADVEQRDGPRYRDRALAV